MRFLPVAMREAALVSRSRASYHWRWGIVALGLVSVLYALANSSQSAAGKNIFTILSTEAFIFCAVAGVLLTADSIASEKRQDTLGILLLTPLRPFDVLAGKVVAATGKSFFGVLAFLPLIALPILLGGVESLQYAVVAANLLATLFLSLSVGILISAIFKNSIVTTTLGFLAPVAIVFAPFAGVAILETVYDVYPPVHWLSPLYSHALALGVFDMVGTLRDVLCSIAAIHLWGWVNLYLAGGLLQRSCTKVPSARAERRFKAVRKLRFGGERARAKLRTLLLDQNPLAWLANREQVSSSGLMALLLAILFGTILWESRSGEDFFLPHLFGDWEWILLLMHGVLIFRMATAACAQLAEDRRSGALELLLSTKLSVTEILRGRSQALMRQFFGPVAIVLFCHGCGMIVVTIQMSVDGAPEPWERGYAFTLGYWIGWGVTFAFAWRAIAMVGAWQGLRRRSSASAVLATFRSIAAPPLAMAIVIVVLISAIGLPYGQERAFMETLMVIEGIFTIGYLYTLGSWARERLQRNFRTAALT